MNDALKSMGFDPKANEAKNIVGRYESSGKGGDRSGSMELDEWAQLVSEFRRLQDRELAERAKAFPPDVRAIFERYDGDRNGRLDYKEVRVALAAFGLDVSDDKSKSYLNKYDRDKSGHMEIDEFALLVEELKRVGCVT